MHAPSTGMCIARNILLLESTSNWSIIILTKKRLLLGTTGRVKKKLEDLDLM